MWLINAPDDTLLSGPSPAGTAVPAAKPSLSASLCPQLPVLSSRAVQLGSLYVRGLSHLLGANCVSGSPLPSAALMPWHSFDGRLFHSKYLLAHSGAERTVLLDGDVSYSREIKKGDSARIMNRDKSDRAAAAASAL